MGIQMKYTRWLKKITILGALLFCIKGTASADHICQTTISYSWILKQALAVSPGIPEGEGVKEPAVAATTPEVKQTVHFGIVERGAVSIDDAKAALQKIVERWKVRASEVCSRDHESVSSCTAVKLESHASTLNALGFSARRELERSISQDCESQQGRCVEVLSSEPICREVVVAAAKDDGATGKEEAKGKEGGKDAKKKK